MAETRAQHIIHRARVKRLALDAAARLRPAAKFTRVSKDFLDNAEVYLRQWIEAQVRRMPSVGVTIK